MSFASDLRDFVDEQQWTFAKTMPEWPHEYIVRERVDRALFERLVVHIRRRRSQGQILREGHHLLRRSGLGLLDNGRAAFGDDHSQQVPD